MKSTMVYQPQARIGDMVGLMIYMNYLKMIEGIHHITFNLKTTKKFIDQSLRWDVLFNTVVDEFIYTEDITSLKYKFNMRHPGCIWVMIPRLVAKYGQQILPYLNFDESLYSGPDFRRDMICFSPLFDPPYNKTRGMSVALVNNIINKLYEQHSDRVVVLTNQPDKITNSKVNIYVDDNLYNMIYIINNARIYIGGDTGFTHFAGLCRPRGLVSIYQPEFMHGFLQLRNEHHVLSYWESRPAIDRETTVHLPLTMNSNMNNIYEFINNIDEEISLNSKGELI